MFLAWELSCFLCNSINVNKLIILILNRITGTSLFKSKKPGDVIKKNKICKLETNHKTFNSISKPGFQFKRYLLSLIKVKSLLLKMLEKSPEKRISLKEICNTKWFLSQYRNIFQTVSTKDLMRPSQDKFLVSPNSPQKKLTKLSVFSNNQTPSNQEICNNDNPGNLLSEVSNLVLAISPLKLDPTPSELSNQDFNNSSPIGKFEEQEKINKNQNNFGKWSPSEIQPKVFDFSEHAISTQNEQCSIVGHLKIKSSMYLGVVFFS